MLTNKKITIIGLGLIGGSIAKAFKKYLNATVIYGVDKDIHTLKMALSEGVILKGFLDIDEPDVLSSDIIVICTPVRPAIGYLNRLVGKISSNTIITDACSTKGDIMTCLNNHPNPPKFIGGHPMAGKEKSGYSQSDADLYQGAIYLLTRYKTTDQNTFLTFFNIVAGIGATPVEIDTQKHDSATGYISHLPHVLAFALVDLVREKDTSGILKQLAAGGFKDISRVASSNPEMWENILISNKIAISNIICEYIVKLENIKSMISNNESEKIISLIDNAGSYRKSITD